MCNSPPREQLALDAVGPEGWPAEGAGDSATEGSRVMGRTLVGKKGITFSDPQILLLAQADLLLFLLSSRSCLKSAAEGVLTAFK